MELGEKVKEISEHEFDDVSVKFRTVFAVVVAIVSAIWILSGVLSDIRTDISITKEMLQNMKAEINQVQARQDTQATSQGTLETASTLNSVLVKRIESRIKETDETLKSIERALNRVEGKIQGN